MKPQPIDTAPIKPFDEDNWYMSHSPHLLLWSGHSWVIGSHGYTRKGKGKWIAYGRICNPTHWLPLPPPPETTQAD